MKLRCLKRMHCIACGSLRVSVDDEKQLIEIAPLNSICRLRRLALSGFSSECRDPVKVWRADGLCPRSNQMFQHPQ